MARALGTFEPCETCVRDLLQTVIISVKHRKDFSMLLVAESITAAAQATQVGRDAQESALPFRLAFSLL